jgi:hypothetical protein
MKLSLRLLAVSVLVLAPAAAVGCSAPDEGDVSTANEELTSAEHTAFKFFVNKGLTRYQAAGIVGNLIQESSVIPTAVEWGGGPGRGIAQWSVGGRWNHDYHDNVTWYASRTGTSRWSLNTQLRFIWYELTTVGGYGLKALRKSGNVTQATIAFENDYEMCGMCDQSKRISYAKQVLKAF